MQASIHYRWNVLQSGLLIEMSNVMTSKQKRGPKFAYAQILPQRLHIFMIFIAPISLSYPAAEMP